MRTLAQIDADMAQLEATREELKGELRKLATERDMVVNYDKLKGMNLPADVKATVLGAFGVKSEEAVGTPGK